MHVYEEIDKAIKELKAWVSSRLSTFKKKESNYIASTMSSLLKARQRLGSNTISISGFHENTARLILNLERFAERIFDSYWIRKTRLKLISIQEKTENLISLEAIQKGT